MQKLKLQPATITDWLTDNLVTIIFVAFTLFGFMVPNGILINFFLSDLFDRFFRNAFLVMSLIIPVMAGLGLNFGIVIGAMAGQIAIVIVRYFGIGGIGGLLLCALIAVPLATLFGWLTGMLYNKTRGQEMIASLIVGFFANGAYQFLLLFVVGIIIPVSMSNPLIKPDGIGILATVDLIAVGNGGLKYALDDLWRMPFMQAAIVVSLVALAFVAYRFLRSRNLLSGKPSKKVLAIGLAVGLVLLALSLAVVFISGVAEALPLPAIVVMGIFQALLVVSAGAAAILLSWNFRGGKTVVGQPMKLWKFVVGAVVCVAVIAVAIHSVVTNSALTLVKQVPVATGLVIGALALFTAFIMNTKLGQDFRTAGQNQHIAKVSGIDVDKTRIIAVIMSTVLGAWGHIIYLQNMGTLSTYTSHSQIGMFSVAALLVGGASTAKASISNAFIGTLLFNAMFIMSPEIGTVVFGNALLGEYFRTFMVYGVIGVALGIYVWKAAKKNRVTVE